MLETALAVAGTAAGVAFINKISDAIGWYTAPRQLVRIAKAEAIAEKIHAESDIEIANLVRRAELRSVTEAISHQANMEDVISKALSIVSVNASPNEMENDWIANFFDKVRIVSDEEMQNSWARILAGEADRPGSFSRKTVNIMADLDKRDAELFVNLCRFAWNIEDRAMPLVYDLHEGLYAGKGITFDGCSRLESLGLIQFNGVTGFFQLVSATSSISYHGQQVSLDLAGSSTNMPVGLVLLTQAGEELYEICEVQAIDEFFSYVRKKLESLGMT